jgi:hypothetical protein
LLSSEGRVAWVFLGQGRKTRDLVTEQCQIVLEGGGKVVKQVANVRRDIASKEIGH